MSRPDDDQEMRDVQDIVTTEKPSPIQRIPPEILIKIFLKCRPLLVYPHGSYAPPHPAEAPLLLCQVSRAWRALATGTAALWSDVWFYFDESDHPSVTEMRNAWISHIGPTSELCITMSGTPPYHLNPILRYVYPFIGRIRELSLDLPHKDLEHLIRLPKGSFHSLEFLTFASCDNEVWENKDLIATFEVAPRLSKIAINCWMGDLRVWRLPLSQLKEFRLGYMYPRISDLWGILSQSPRLKEFLLYEVHDEPTLDVCPAPITLPNLDTIVFNVSNASLGMFFEPLVLPSLKVLEISFECGPTPWAHETFLSLRNRSSFRLEKLILRCTSITLEQVIDILAGMPSLVELSLDQAVKLTSEFFDALTIRENHVLVPQLAALLLGDTRSVWDDVDEDFMDQDVVDMIRSRRSPSNSRLKKFMFYVDGKVLDDQTKLQLKRFREEGLELTFRGGLSNV